jgi:adenylate cyclase
MGSGQATSLTAIGDAVNTASRLEAATKDFGAQLVVSAEVAKRAGADLSFARPEQIRVRGRERPLDVWVVEDALKLPL